MKPQKDTLVIIQPLGKKPENPCWGIIEYEMVTPNSREFRVRISPKENITVFAGQVVPIMHTDGSVKDPHKFVRKNADKLLIDILRKIFVKRETEALLSLIQNNTLVIVLPGEQKSEKACFGVVIRKMPSQQYEVVIRIGYGGLRRRAIFVEPSRLIPVIQTDGSTLNPVKAVRRNWHKIIIHIILRLHTTNGAISLQRLLSSISTIEKDLLF